MARALGLAGARVLLVARREAELDAAAQQLRSEGIEADTLAADLSERGTHCAPRRSAAGGIDILVNAAGINLRQPFAEVTPEAWQTQLALHLGAPFFLTQALAPGMAARGWGRIDQHRLAAKPPRVCQQRTLWRRQGRHRAAHARDRAGVGPQAASPATRSAPASSRPR